MSIRTDDNGIPYDYEHQRDRGTPYRTGNKILKAFHSSETIQDMIVCEGILYVSTNKMVYKVVDDVLIKLTIQLVEDK